jgi:hypothetical protein
LRGCAKSRLPPAINPTIGAQKKIRIKESAIIRAVITPFIDQSPAKNAKSFAFYYLALYKNSRFISFSGFYFPQDTWSILTPSLPIKKPSSCKEKIIF